MDTVAAIAVAPLEPFVVEPVTLDAPRPNEVLVRIAGVGVCHTDLAVKASGRLLPAVLGHEGAGIVEAIGADVSTLAVGDPVVLSFFSCRACATCRTGQVAYCEKGQAANFGGARLDGTRPIAWRGEPIASHFFGQSSFAHHALVDAASAVKIDTAVPLAHCGPLGCGLLTGAGAVLNVLRPTAGQSLAVFGCGPVGLAAVMAARALGVSTLFAVDVVPARLALATALGATHVIDNRQDDVVRRIRALGGVDFSVECVGAPAVVRQAFCALRPRGTAALLGLPHPGAEAAIDLTALLRGRRLVGVIEGDADPQTLIPQLLALHREGRFPFERLIRTYPLSAINEAIADLHAGAAVKAVLLPERGTA